MYPVWMTAAPRCFHGSMPWTATEPSVGRSNPTHALMSVDLPAPFGPTSAVIEPTGTSRSTDRSAQTREPYRLPSPCASSAGAAPSPAVISPFPQRRFGHRMGGRYDPDSYLDVVDLRRYATPPGVHRERTQRSDGRERVFMGRSKAAVAAALLTALALLPIAAAPVLARDHAASERARVLSYWTKERIANAKPRDYVRNADGTFSRAKPTPQAKPGGSGNNVLGASWTGGGAVLKLSGKVLFTMNSGDYICSGTLISDTASDRSIVLTAGHCSYDAADGGFARN